MSFSYKCHPHVLNIVCQKNVVEVVLKLRSDVLPVIIHGKSNFQNDLERDLDICLYFKKLWN